MMQRAAGAVISNGEWVISFFSQVLNERCWTSLYRRGLPILPRGNAAHGGEDAAHGG